VVLGGYELFGPAALATPKLSGHFGCLAQSKVKILKQMR
jgi:hypothetical protein